MASARRDVATPYQYGVPSPGLPSTSGCGSFSLEPPRGHALEEARLSAELRGMPRQLEPIAFDLFPLDVSEEVQRDVKLTFAPSLKLEKIVTR